MPLQSAVGSIETKGFPGILAAADAMVKAGRVTLVGYIRVGSARFNVNIRGDVSEVKTAMDAGIEAVKKAEGALNFLCAYYLLINLFKSVSGSYRST